MKESRVISVEETAPNGRKDRSRKFLPHRVPSAVLVAAFVSAALLLLASVGSRSAAAHEDLTVRVENAVITLHIGVDVFEAGRAVTDFIVIGDITEVDGEPATGKFYCKGVFVDPVGSGLPPLATGTPAPDGATFVTQRFLIDGVGSIIGNGNEFSEEPLAVSGGTGHFTGVHGTYSGVGLPIPVDDGFLTFEFQLRRG